MFMQETLIGLLGLFKKKKKKEEEQKKERKKHESGKGKHWEGPGKWDEELEGHVIKLQCVCVFYKVVKQHIQSTFKHAAFLKWC